MFVETAPPFDSSASSEMLSISLDAELIRENRISINISPLCGDDQPKFSQTTQPTTFRAKPLDRGFLTAILLSNPKIRV